MIKNQIHGGISADKTGIYGYGFTRYGEYGKPTEKFYWNFTNTTDGAQIKLRQIAKVNNIKDVYTCGLTSYALTTSSVLYGWGLDFGLGYKTPHSWEPKLIATNVKQFYYIQIMNGPDRGYSKYYLTHDDELYIFGYVNMSETEIIHIIEPTLLADGVEKFENGLLLLKPEGKFHSLYSGVINTDIDWPNKVAPKPMQVPMTYNFNKWEPLRDTYGPWYMNPNDHPSNSIRYLIAAGGMTFKENRKIITSGYIGVRNSGFRFVKQTTNTDSYGRIRLPNMASADDIWLQSDEKYIRGPMQWMQARPHIEQEQKYAVYKYTLTYKNSPLFNLNIGKKFYSAHGQKFRKAFCVTPPDFTCVHASYSWTIPSPIKTQDFTNNYTYTSFYISTMTATIRHGGTKITGIAMADDTLAMSSYDGTYSWGVFMHCPYYILNAYYAPLETLI